MPVHLGDIMKGYIITLILLSAVSFIIKGICVNKRMAGILSFVCGLMLTLSVIAPIRNVFENIINIGNADIFEYETKSYEEYATIFDDYIYGGVLREYEYEIKYDIARNFSVNEKCIDVDIEIYGSDIKSITLYLYGDGIFIESDRLKQYLKKKYKCDVYIKVGD